mmetsp:Transcript_98149/g.218977  ORF Transcript_98149/g.218977 Transcript_98149/m.218977 type:complete len:231 (+) Transcript_98149:82-774(+)
MPCGRALGPVAGNRTGSPLWCHSGGSGGRGGHCQGTLSVEAPELEAAFRIAPLRLPRESLLRVRWLVVELERLFHASDADHEAMLCQIGKLAVLVLHDEGPVEKLLLHPGLLQNHFARCEVHSGQITLHILERSQLLILLPPVVKVSIGIVEDYRIVVVVRLIGFLQPVAIVGNIAVNSQREGWLVMRVQADDTLPVLVLSEREEGLKFPVHVGRFLDLVKVRHLSRPSP